MSQTPTISSSEELCSLVSYALDTALSLGATAAAVEVSEEKGTCVTVRNQETESIEHTHDRDFGITVYLGKSKAVASSGDFRKVSILRTVKAALDMARYTTPDECNGLPDKDRLCTNPRQLDLFHPWDISIEEQVQKAVEAEKAALDVDKRVVNSDGAMVTTTIGSFILGNTEGFLHGYPFSDHSIDTSVIAEDENGMQVGSWHTSGVSSMDLLSPQQVGMIAGQRAVDHLSARGLAYSEPLFMRQAVLRCTARPPSSKECSINRFSPIIFPFWKIHSSRVTGARRRLTMRGFARLNAWSLTTVC